MRKSSYVIVEPHADDAFLSLGGHIERWVKEGSEVAIVTVFSGTRKRGRDAAAYAKAAGAYLWIPLEAIEGEGFNITDLGIQNRKAKIILPLAITHPEHVAVRKKFEKFDSLFYVDQPYAITQKNSKRLTELLKGMEVVSYLKPGIRKYRHIPLFKDQAKFFHFNPPEKLRETFEMIVRRIR